MQSMLNGMFGKIKPGLCRLSMNGNIAIQTSNGWILVGGTENENDTK